MGKITYRTEHDSFGEIKVPANKLWGAQTERSRLNFPIGDEKMPKDIIVALAMIKRAAAVVNNRLRPEKMTFEKMGAIVEACDEIIQGNMFDEFPLSVWQTGSGTQTNMNVNEVISNHANLKADAVVLHPNDDVNMSQSSNDVFPTAMHLAAVITIIRDLLPALSEMIDTLKVLEKENEDVIKCGRTHLQDATPIMFSQEISGWRGMLEVSRDQISMTCKGLSSLAIGGTAVGTGINAPEGFGEAVTKELSQLTSMNFVNSPNKFHSLSSKDEMAFAHGALKALAADLMKIANDIRWLAAGPRCGLGEISIPENEPGSSIMPGKVNPTQCESITMIALQVMSNDTAIGMAASQGNFELNVFMPLIAYNFCQSARLLADGIKSFNQRCVKGIKANKEKMKEYLDNSLMPVTALTPYIGYENAAKIAKKAHSENTSIKEACLSLGFLSEKEFDEYYKPEAMC